ncbi:cupin domain-containing protein [Microbacterium sp. LMI12-1-1.1]|jgi:transcriptional regulator with XRE-family HTH domain|uniref:helix-turn-helix domain-containing protein n=1 Tax=unclassified Microbacterium TaxID=2609290 RepID=UPI003435DDC8
MGEVPAQIGPRLRTLRAATGRSLSSVAHELGISSSALSQIETGAMQPSVNRLIELVGVLGVPVSAIFDDTGVFAPRVDADHPDVTEALPGVLVAHAGDTHPAQLDQGVTYRRLSPAQLPGVDWFESTYPPGSASSVDGAMLVHAGYESGRVVSGELTFEFGDGSVRLGPGGSLSFSASRPHRVVNDTAEPAVAIWLTLTDVTAHDAGAS